MFVEPLAAAIQTFELIPVNKDDKVAVLGVGRLGTLISAVANSLGARVIAISRSKRKLESAKKFGASEVINSSLEDSVQKVKDITNGVGADIVVEATGTAEGLSVALELVRPRGTIALKTTCGLVSPGVNFTKAVVDEIRVQGSRCGPFDKAIETLKSGMIPVGSLISDSYSLENVKDAILAANTASKVVIDLED